MMYKPFIAGLLIALGGYANMKVGGALGAFLFSLGLLSVIRFKTPLYTGMVSDLKALLVFPTMQECSSSRLSYGQHF